MTTTRILPGVVLVAMATAGPAWGQFRKPGYTPTEWSAGAVPSVLPAGATEPPAPPPAAPPASSLERMTAPPTPAAADPYRTLTTPVQPSLPPGSYASPWYGDGPGCCGPTGRHGQVAYELYSRTGPNLPFGSGPFTDRLHLGWTVAGGGRTLLFNPEGDAAWAFDLGLSYTYNRGSNDDFLDLFIRQPNATNAATGLSSPQPDRFTTTRIRGLHRTSFNFALGREWFVWGPGQPGAEDGWNFRMGADVGGRWGTAHIDLVPLDGGDGSYSRRQKVFEGIFFAAHSNFEVPLGGWIWTIGTRVEYGYDWMNIAPPVNSDVQYVNLLFTTGLRF